MATPSEANPILVMLGSGVIGIGITMLGFFVKNYFTSRDKKSETDDAERKQLVEALNEFKLEMTRLDGERKTEHAKMYGKFKEVETKLDNYTRENNKLSGKMEQNTEQLTKCNTLLDHVSRQAKRLFDIVEPMEKDVEQLKKVNNG